MQCIKRFFDRLFFKKRCGQPIWHRHLILCPSQIDTLIEADGKRYFIYLRWRHSDPWSAELVPATDKGEYDYDSSWYDLDVGFYTHDDYTKLESECVRIVEKMFVEVKYLDY